MSKNGNGNGKYVIGALVGASVALLFAPKSGKELRADLKNKMEEVIEDVKNLDMKEVKESILDKINEIEEDIKNFDKEKLVDGAKEKAKEIEKKTALLVKEAEKAARPKLIKLTNEVKKKTIKTLNAAIDKLEEDTK
ncbi:MAG: YtxH domain-containing protein [bacterium]